MWKYVKGVSPPAAKRPKTESEKLEKAKEYETKRVRSSQSSWFQKFRWLQEEQINEVNKLFCQICRKYEHVGTFVTGCTNYKIDTLRKHDTSVGHQTNMCKYEASQAKPGTSKAEHSLQLMNKSLYEKLSHLFKSAHSLAKHGRPYSDFHWLCDLLESVGVNIGKSYRTDKKCAEFVTSIAQSQRAKMITIFEQCKFFSLISDGATDSSHQEAEICYVKLCSKGVKNTFYLGIKNVPKADAENISKVLISLLDAFFENWQNKFIGTGTDGASVMLGSNNGVVKKLMNHTNRPFIFPVHCSAHRLELAYKESCKGIKIFETVNALLLNLYMFYRNSPLNRSNLKASFHTFARSPVIPSRVGGTRWVAHIGRAINNILEGYGPIVTHLTQMRNPDDRVSRGESAAKAKNFLKHLTRKDIMYFLFFLADVINCLSTLSLQFQEQDATVADIYSEMEATKAVLESYKTSNGPKLEEIFEKDKYDDQELSGNIVSFEAGKRNLLSKLLQNMDKRFEAKKEVIVATSIARLCTYPNKLQDRPDFGDKDIAVLVAEFQPALMSAGILEPNSLKTEWTRFKTHLYNSVVTPRERILLSQRQYGSLVEEQVKSDKQKDAELVQQEEELRREEEAYYEAKRAAAHAARVQRQWEQAGKTNALMLKNGPKGWVAEDDDEWDVAGGDDDFEMFLENVKARSLAARTRALPSQVPVDQQSTSSLTSKDRTDDAASSLDLEWEHEAGMQPPPKRDKKKHVKEDTNLLAELAVKPMLHLKDKQDSFSNDFEWDSDIGGDNSDQNSESRTLLSNSTENVER